MKYAAALFVTSIASLQPLGVGFAQTACNAPALPLAGTRVVNVATEPALQAAMNNLQPGDTVLIADGTYNLASSLYINGKDNVTIRGTSGCTGVVLAGKGMDTSSASVPFGIWSNSRNTTIAHLTIRDTWDNEIIFNSGAQAPHVYDDFRRGDENIARTDRAPERRILQRVHAAQAILAVGAEHLHLAQCQEHRPLDRDAEGRRRDHAELSGVVEIARATVGEPSCVRLSEARAYF